MSEEKAIEEFKSQIKSIKQEMDNLITSIENNREELSESVLGQTNELKSTVKSLGKQSVLLQSIPKQLSEKLNNKVPDIASEISKLNQKHFEDALQAYKNQHQELLEVQKRNIVKYNSLVKDVAIEINKVKEDFALIDKSRMKRYFLSMLGIGVFSVLLSLGSTRLMMSYFPSRISIDSAGKIEAEKSDISIFGVREVSIPKDNKFHIYKQK